jgi:transposase
MAPKFFIGIDISKLTLDVAVLEDSVLLLTSKISNTEAAVKQLLAGLAKKYDCTVVNTVYCAENMGLYTRYLRDVFSINGGRLCLEGPLQIKLSLGIQRGKSDTLDSIKIADYARKNFTSLRFWTRPRPSIEKLKTLASIRKKLIKMRTMLQNSGKIESHFLSKEEKSEIGAYTKSSFSALNKDIEAIEREITSIINMDGHLHNLMQIITSIPYVGKVIAAEMIISTNEFKDITSPKKFSSYCGIAPFAKTSGTSLRTKSRVSHFANKDMKTVLHLAALGSTRRGQSKFQTYYARKVREGKNKMSVLNAVRNKLVHVIFACVRDNKLYEEPA